MFCIYKTLPLLVTNTWTLVTVTETLQMYFILEG